MSVRNTTRLNRTFGWGLCFPTVETSRSTSQIDGQVIEAGNPPSMEDGCNNNRDMNGCELEWKRWMRQREK